MASWELPSLKRVVTGVATGGMSEYARAAKNAGVPGADKVSDAVDQYGLPVAGAVAGGTFAGPAGAAAGFSAGKLVNDKLSEGGGGGGGGSGGIDPELKKQLDAAGYVQPPPGAPPAPNGQPVRTTQKFDGQIADDRQLLLQQLQQQGRPAPQVTAAHGTASTFAGAPAATTYTRGAPATVQMPGANPVSRAAAHTTDGAQLNTTQANATRQGQTNLIGSLQDAANGTGGPSAAQATMQKGLDASLNQQLALAASARGGAQAGAWRAAGRNQAALAQGAVNDAAILQANEQQAARGLLGQVLGQTRGQDIDVAGQDASLRNSALMQGAALGTQVSQFNAGQTNDMRQFDTNAALDAGKFNADAENTADAQTMNARNTVGMFNTSEGNKVGMFNTGQVNDMSQFNAGESNKVGIANGGFEMDTRRLDEDRRRSLMQQLGVNTGQGRAGAESDRNFDLTKILSQLDVQDAQRKLELAEKQRQDGIAAGNMRMLQDGMTLAFQQRGAR